MFGLRGHWRGRILRGGLAALPLVAVITLCVMMMAWRGKSDAKEVVEPPADVALRANASEMASASNDASPPPVAEFQRLHVLHATIHVPQ